VIRSRYVQAIMISPSTSPRWPRVQYRGCGKPTSMRPGVSHRTRRSPAICVRHAIAMSSLPLFQRCPFRASWLPDVSGRRAARRSRTAAGAYSSLRAPDHHRTGSRADRCCMGKEIRERASSAAGARQWTHAGVDASDDTRLATVCNRGRQCTVRTKRCFGARRDFCNGNIAYGHRSLLAALQSADTDRSRRRGPDATPQHQRRAAHRSRRHRSRHAAGRLTGTICAHRYRLPSEHHAHGTFGRNRSGPLVRCDHADGSISGPESRRRQATDHCRACSTDRLLAHIFIAAINI